MSHPLMAWALLAASVSAVSANAEREALALRYINSITLEKNAVVGGTRVGGLSAIVRDPNRDVYYSPADASEHGGARIYTMRLNWTGGRLAAADFLGVERLRGRDGRPLKAADLEGAALSFRNTLWLSSEPLPDPWLCAFDCRTGGQVGEIALPEAFIKPIGAPVDGAANAPAQAGLEPNRGIESLSISPDGRRMWTATEASPLQDREAVGSRVSRITRYARRGLQWQVESERLHTIGGRGTINSVSEILALDESHLLVLERRVKGWNATSNDFAFSIFLVDYDQPGASDVLGRKADGNEVRLKKTLLFDSARDGVRAADNVEGMCLGPLIGGRQTLILISDDNFRDEQTTRLHALDFGIAVSPVLPLASSVATP